MRRGSRLNKTCAEQSRSREGSCRAIRRGLAHAEGLRGANVVVGNRVPFAEARDTRRALGYVSGDAELEVPWEHPNGDIT